jgi:preprotein translocase subunit SecG
MLLGILLADIIVVCVALVGVILLQRSEGGVLGMSGGGPGNFMSARGTGDLLTRTTQILAGIFFSLCLIMTLLTGRVHRDDALASKLKDLSIAPPTASSQPPAQSAAAAPLAPAAPAAPAPQGLDLFGSSARPAAGSRPADPARHTRRAQGRFQRQARAALVGQAGGGAQAQTRRVLACASVQRPGGKRSGRRGASADPASACSSARRTGQFARRSIGRGQSLCVPDGSQARARRITANLDAHGPVHLHHRRRGLIPG